MRRGPKSGDGVGFVSEGIGRLAGLTAIVTGATSPIGAGAASELARQGARVVLADRCAETLRARALELAESGGTVLAVTTELSDGAQTADLVERAHGAFGWVDVLVNAAGGEASELPTDTPAEQIAQTTRGDLVGTMRLTRLVLPEMLQRRHGAIVSVASLQARVGNDSVASATAFGIRGFTLALRRQVTGSGIGVSLLTAGTASPPRVGRIIADLVIRPRREVVVPSSLRAIAWLDEVLPGVAAIAFRGAHRRPRRGSAQGWEIQGVGAPE